MQEELPILGKNNRCPESQSASVAESERQKSEQRLRHIHDLEMVGRFAGGIVHGLNNILTVIVGSSQLLLDHPEVGTSARDRVQQIFDAGFRAANLTSELLAFTHKQSPRAVPLDLNKVIRENTIMLRFLIGNGIELKTELEADLSHISADKGQMEQVLINLCVNARDAMPQGGSIVIESQNVDVETEYSVNPQFPIKPGRYVRFSVNDTGVGMDLATLRRVFEPFFTTKEPDKRMGLGLATVQSIVKQTCGFVRAESQLGEGSTFSVFLPALAEPARSQPKDYMLLENIRGTETILLLDDPASSLQETLENLGYTVLPAEDVERAEEIADRHGDIALLLTDISLPRINGLTFVANLRKSRPEMKVLQLTPPPSGFVNYGFTHEGCDFIRKPFTSRALAQKLRHLLGK